MKSRPVPKPSGAVSKAVLPVLPLARRYAAAVAAARQESLLMLALWLAALGLQTVPEELSSPDLSVWTAVLLIQSIPYAAALAVSLISAFNLPARWLGSTPSPAVGGPAEQGGRP